MPACPPGARRLDDDRSEALGRAVHRGGEPRRPGAEDDDVVLSRRRLDVEPRRDGDLAHVGATSRRAVGQFEDRVRLALRRTVEGDALVGHLVAHEERRAVLLARKVRKSGMVIICPASDLVAARASERGSLRR